MSVCGLIFIATTIMFNKKLQTPPQPMLAWICIAEACMSYHALIEVINPLYFICYTKSYRTFWKTIFHLNVDKGSKDETKAANILCESNQIFYAFFQLISLTLNTCLCIDLILTIYDPFSPAGRRTKLYYLFSLVISTFIIIIIFGIDTGLDKKTS